MQNLDAPYPGHTAHHRRLPFHAAWHGKIIRHAAIEMFDNLLLVSLLGLAGILELVGGLLIIVGLFTRQAAFILSGEMAFAYFMAHAPNGLLPILNQGELAVMYCFVFLYFSVASAFSIDARRGKA
jgi:putative oxidoreductase